MKDIWNCLCELRDKALMDDTETKDGAKVMDDDKAEALHILR